MSTNETARPYAVGDSVTVRPEHHRAGERGTVVRPGPETARPDWAPADALAVAFASVSGGPLWYGPDELQHDDSGQRAALGLGPDDSPDYVTAAGIVETIDSATAGLPDGSALAEYLHAAPHFTGNVANDIRPFRFRVTLDNYSPPRNYGGGYGVTYRHADSGETRAVLDCSGLPMGPEHTVYLLDDGRTVRPLYVAGWRTDGPIIFLAPMPTDYSPDGARRERGDGRGPVDMSSWQLGPSRAYHLKVSAL